MRKQFLALVSVGLLLGGCVQEGRVCDTTYKAYGFANPENKNPNVNYDISVANIILAAVFSETIIVPIIVAGWFLYVPEGPASQPGVGGGSCPKKS